MIQNKNKKFYSKPLVALPQSGYEVFRKSAPLFEIEDTMIETQTSCQEYRIFLLTSSHLHRPAWAAARFPCKHPSFIGFHNNMRCCAVWFGARVVCLHVNGVAFFMHIYSILLYLSIDRYHHSIHTHTNTTNANRIYSIVNESFVLARSNCESNFHVVNKHWTKKCSNECKTMLN